MPPVPRLVAISAHGAGDTPGWRAWCLALAEAEVDAMMIRERGLDDLEVARLAEAAREALGATRMLIHRRFDLALACDADGVHLPWSGLPAARIRPRLGPGRLIGRSTHTLEEIDTAREEGADYAVYGPIFPTPSKEGLLEPRGLDGLAAACRRGVPVVAIGGLDAARARGAFAAGAAGIAAIRAFADRTSAAALVAAARERVA